MITLAIAVPSIRERVLVVLDHVKRALLAVTVRTNPVVWDVLPARARGDAMLWHAVLGAINESTQQTAHHHGGLARPAPRRARAWRHRRARRRRRLARSARA